ncbi:hypothetical protein [Streptomyces sp. NPDC059979]|uniref:hypothetical protein n=1 Tax=Streptomyces sp. NPDC059979 TaxID=3347021 RepID=UPI0036A77328
MIDPQSVKADAVVGSDSRGFDGGKLINGRKRHVVVDTFGLLLFAGAMLKTCGSGLGWHAKGVPSRVID